MNMYFVGLVGESHYQAEIADCYEGETIRICFERDNPYDALALRAENSSGDVIGYVPRTNWLREAIHESGRGCAATIKSINEGGDAAQLGVVLFVTLTDDLIPERNYGISGRRSARLFDRVAKWISRE